MTRERNLGQVNFYDKGFENAANLLVENSSNRGFHILCEKTSSKLGTVETDEAKLSIVCSRG